MTPTEEHKLLLGMLKNLEAPTSDWSWPAFLVESTAWCSLAIIALWFSHRPGERDWLLAAVLVGVFLGGALLGAISLWRKLCHRGNLVRPYIDQDKIRARLADLEA